MRRAAFLLLLAACTAADAIGPNTMAMRSITAMITGTWSATGGTIQPLTDSTARYTAGTTPGSYRVTYTTSEGKAGTSLITICALAGTLTLNTHSATLTIADTLQLTATVTDHCEVADTSIAVTWVSRSTSVATVTNTGTQRARVTAVAAGYSYIVATAGTRRDSALVCVNGTQVDVQPSALSLAVSATGTLTGHVSNCSGALGTAVTWVSRNTGIATCVTLGTQTATVTGVAAGSVYCVGTASGVSDSSLITVTTAVGGGSLPYAPGPPASLRTVNVSNQSQLLAAIADATPGDSIHLAAGTYSGGVQLACGKAGTSANPILIIGPRTAVIDNGDVGYGIRIRGPYIQVRGLKIQNAQFGIFVEKCSGSAAPSNVVIDRVEIASVTQNGVVLRNANSSYVQRSKIHHVSGANWTEGIYVGHSGDPAQMSSNYFILGDTLGPGIEQEHVDVKGLPGGRSTNGLIQGNISDATGTLFVTSPASNGVYADQGGDGTKWIGNTITGITSTGLSGIFFYTAVRPVARTNSVNGGSAIPGAYGFRILSPVTDWKIYCDNTGTKNFTCTP